MPRKIAAHRQPNRGHPILRPGLLYFAYGCNMDRDLLGGVLGLQLADGYAARADGWQLAFNKGGEGESGDEVTASLVEQKDCCVYGVVYSVPKEALAALDDFEGVPEHYRRDTLWVQPEGRQAHQAVLTYLGQPRWEVPERDPEPGYLDALLRAAAAHRLPERYIDWLRSLAGGKASRCFPRPDG